MIFIEYFKNTNGQTYLKKSTSTTIKIRSEYNKPRKILKDHIFKETAFKILHHAYKILVLCALFRYPDEDAGQLPMAFIVMKPGSNISKQQVMDYVAKHVWFFRFHT
jgi:hypothetical protein